MGILSKLNPAAKSAQAFNSLNVADPAMKWMRENPAMSKVVTTAIGVAFPPARAAVAALEVANKLKGTLENKPFGEAVKAWGATDGKSMSLKDRAQAAMSFQSSRQREHAAMA